MKMLDNVKLIRDRAEYTKDGVHLGDTGTIMLDEVRSGYMLVNFDTNIYKKENGNFESTEVLCAVRVEDMEVISEDEVIEHANKITSETK